MTKKTFEASIDEAFAFAEQVMEHPDRFPDKFVVLPVTSDLAGRLFTPQRRRLLEDLKRHGSHESVAALAACVHRDPTRVSRDLKPLIEAGLVQASPFGKNKRISATNRPVILQ